MFAQGGRAASHCPGSRGASQYRAPPAHPPERWISAMSSSGLGVTDGALYRLRRPSAGGAGVFALPARHFQVSSPLARPRRTRVYAVLRGAVLANPASTGSSPSGSDRTWAAAIVQRPASTATSTAGNCPGFFARCLEVCAQPLNVRHPCAKNRSYAGASGESPTDRFCGTGERPPESNP